MSSVNLVQIALQDALNELVVLPSMPVTTAVVRVGEKTSGVSEAGKINTLCPNTAFKSTFTLRSRLYCLFYSPPDAGSIAEDIVARNTGNPNTPLNVWNFATESNSPMITSSQCVSVEMPSTD